ncbi:MAG: hydrogenobyrinic acid a,c-diamide synthase (glutamine-hydrolyzing) [Nitrospinae bacterium]|nr:hydrogenobyrinic acid a,c-diamide synthase (glutamine-hydrolyzing) [Nitrospinota bacterium]
MFGIDRLTISGTSRSSGKTTFSIGLLDIFRRRGIAVQPFKKGPDYIDPMWLSAAAGRECRNLDFHMMGRENMLRSFQTASQGATLAVIEGNQGLFDGLDLEGGDSTASLARLLDAPLFLVVDSSRMNRGIAPLLWGYTHFDPSLKIAGIILNKVGNPRHEAKLVAAIDRYVGVPVFGAIPKMPDELEMLERHLGLIPVKEDPALPEKIGVIGLAVERHCDIGRMLSIAKTASPMKKTGPCLRGPEKKADVAIGVAMDRAFTFYYPDNLDALKHAGARIVPFSPISDQDLPEVNGLYIGGGFPEVFMGQLAANTSLLRRVKEEAEAGLPIYGECGGLMYLCRSIVWKGEIRGMAGVIPADVEMTKKPVGLGYVTMEPTGECPWLHPGAEIRCHEFHHSRLINVADGLIFAYNVKRGHGITGKRDGIVYKNVLASYAHLHHCGSPNWAEDFVNLVRSAGKTVAPAGKTLARIGG